ncbi:MAG: imidazole glycerol phosphate synthase subunit HisH [Verrucomicrobiales bacterium]|nr:imidazole glycerol phosphate synthase subunit HisH [Verrucomicrobiales bacterium]
MSKETTGIIDYGAGNLLSVHNALKSQNIDARIVSTPEHFAGLDRLIFPGVGAFGDSLRHIDEQNLRAPLLQWLQDDKPFLGICIGYQVLFEGSEEAPGVNGLGFLKGQVVHFQSKKDLKIPHMGWNQVSFKDPSDPLWKGIPEDAYFYYVHSYYPAPADQNLISASTHYSTDFAAGIRKGNICAVQFHPERSQELGLRFLRNFVDSTR